MSPALIYTSLPVTSLLGFSLMTLQTNFSISGMNQMRMPVLMRLKTVCSMEML